MMNEEKVLDAAPSPEITGFSAFCLLPSAF
jgi:hypothetical protein